MIRETIDKRLLDLSAEADEELKKIYEGIDETCLKNSDRILKAFIDNKVSYTDFADINGYGNYDSGRDKLEKIFADVLGFPLEVVETKELGTLGAAMAAAVCAGVYRDYPDAAGNMVACNETIYPDPARIGIYKKKYKAYRQIIDRLEGR